MSDERRIRRPRPISFYLAALLALVVAATAASIFYVAIQSNRDSRSAALRDANFAAHTAASQLGESIESTKSTVEALAANPQIAQVFATPKGCTLSFASLAAPDRSHLDILSPKGSVACSSRAVDGPSAVYRSRSWLKTALRRPLVLAPVDDPRTGAKVALISAPIPHEQGVIAAFVDLGSLGPKLVQLYGGGKPFEFLVTTRDGSTVLARSIAPARWVGAPAAGSSFDPTAASEHADLDGTTRLYREVAVPGSGWRFYAGEDAALALSAGRSLENRELVIALVGLLAALLAFFLLHRSLVTPIRRLSHALRVSAVESGTSPMPIGGPSEVVALGQGVNSLITSVAKELQQRETAEERLRSSERSYRHLFEGNPNPMWIYDVETLCFLAVNDAAVQSYGYSRDEFLAMTIEGIRPPEEQKRLQALLEAPAIDGEPPTAVSITGIWRHQRKDGSLLDAEVISHAHDFAGRSARVVLALDVTEQLQSEQALRRSESRYRDLFENASDLIATVDTESRLTAVNEAFLKALGYSRDELIGRPISEFVPAEWHEQLQQARADKLDGADASVYEHELVAKDGTRITVEVASRAIREDDAIIGVEAICRDITMRRQLEEQLRHAQRLESVGRLAGGIAHDFNNLLTVIGGYSSLLLEQRNGNAEPELRHIADAAERAASLTRQLLAFSRRQVLQPSTIDLNRVIDDVGPMLGRLIGEDITLITSLDAEVAPVLADQSQIEQVLVNLVVNARDAMPDGGVLTVTTRTVELDADYVATHPDATVGSHTMLSVSDTGTGIDPDTVDHIFEPFFTTKPVGVGTGLGLSTVYGIVKQSGGNIWVYSEPAEGTTFKVYLPEAAGDAVEDTERNAEKPLPAKGTETILVVEDEVSLRELIAGALSIRGYRVLVADGTEDALELAGTNEIDLVLADVVMPHMNGRELADRIRGNQPKPLVLFMSGYTDDAVIRSGALEPGSAFLEKPFSAQKLAATIRRILDEAHAVAA